MDPSHCDVIRWCMTSSDILTYICILFMLCMLFLCVLHISLTLFAHQLLVLNNKFNLNLQFVTPFTYSEGLIDHCAAV